MLILIRGGGLWYCFDMNMERGQTGGPAHPGHRPLLDVVAGEVGGQRVEAMSRSATTRLTETRNSLAWLDIDIQDY